MNQPTTISARRAYELLSELGDRGSADPPGTAVFGFRLNDGRPASETHRHQILDRLDRTIIPHAQTVQDQVRVQLDAGRATPAQLDACGETLKDLAALRRFLVSTPLRPRRP